jgi:outer membrane protein TolC
MKNCFIITFIVLFLTLQASAAEQLTLKEAISLAMEKNNLVRAAGFSATAASMGIDIVKSRYYPTVSFEETFAVSNAPTQVFMMKLDQGRFTQNDFQIGNLNHPSAWHDFKSTLSIQQPLYLPSLSSLKELAVKDAEKSGLEFETARQEVAFQVFSLYLEVRKSDARLKTAEKAKADVAENMRLASVRTVAGVGLRSDELRARTHQLQVEQQIITAQNDLALARMQLAMRIGLAEDQAFDISPLSDIVTVPSLNEDIIKGALAGRIDMKQSRTDLEKSDAAFRLARSGYLPTVGAFASYQLNGKEAPIGAENDAWVAGLNLKWQLFEGFRSNHERNRATAGRSAAMEMLESRSKDVRYQLKESYLRWDEAAKRLEVARHALLDAEEAVRLITKRFENSLATMVELLDAQTALNQTRANLVETEAGYALAGGRVHYAAGIFLKEMLK